MQFTLTRFGLALACAGLVTLYGCGGGGGSGAAAPGASSSSTVSGTASKGLLQNAIVTAYCGVKASNNAIRSTRTDTNGLYSLTLSGTCASPVQVVVTADQNTTMLDEIAGPIAAPTNLVMRAFITNTGSTISQPVTPFTDMAAAVVENSIGSSNPLSLAMVANANTAIITNVLGGNAGLFTAQPLPPTAYADGTTSADQKQLIVLLAAISQAAQTATGATAGDKVQTILTQLATQAKQTVAAVNATGYTVSPTVSTAAITGVTASPLATISSGLTALATSTSTNLGPEIATITSSATTTQTAVVAASNTQITTTQTAGGTVSTPSTAVQTAIDAARTLFVKIRSNAIELSNGSNTGFLNLKSTAVTNDVNTNVVSGNYDFVNIVKAAHRTTALLVQTNSALALGGGSAHTPVGAVSPVANAFGDFYKRVWSDSADGTQNSTCVAYYTAGAGVTSITPNRTAPFADNGNHPVAICKQFIFNGNNVKEMQFVVKSPVANPTTGTNTFAYTNRVRTWASAACTDASNASCLYTDAGVSGQLTATVDSNLAVTGMAIASQPVIPFVGSTATTMSVNYAASQANYVTNVAFSGGLTSGALKYAFVSGSHLVLTDTSANHDGSSGTVDAALIGQVQTAAFQYDGTFSIAGNATSGTDPLGTVSFIGKISALSGSVATAFLEGSLTGNSATKVVAFSGKVSNGASVNDLSITANTFTAGQTTASVTFLTPGYTFTVAGTSYDNQATPSVTTVTASDGTKLVSTRVNGSSTTVVKNSAGTQIGTLSSNGNQVNFNDGSYIILN